MKNKITTDKPMNQPNETLSVEKVKELIVRETIAAYNKGVADGIHYVEEAVDYAAGINYPELKQKNAS